MAVRPSAERRGAERQQQAGARRAPEQAPAYEAAVEKYQEAGDHVEYCILVTHRSGLRWRVWRRFSAFQQLHADLLTALGGEAQRRRLPSPPQKSWLPSFTQALAGEFCEQRQREMQAYLDAVLADASLSHQEPLQELLGVRPPEPPAGLRVVPRAAGHELEVRPACIASADCEEPTPVEGYQIEILHCDSGARHPITREVGCSGLQLQRAQIGQLAPGKHQFAVSAFNYAGTSSAISIVVDTALLPPASSPAASPPPAPPPAAPAAPQAPPAPQSPGGPEERPPPAAQPEGGRQRQLGGAEALLAAATASSSRPGAGCSARPSPTPPGDRADARAAAAGGHAPSSPALAVRGADGGGPALQRPTAARPPLQASVLNQNWTPGSGSVRRPRHLQAAPPAAQQPRPAAQQPQPLRGWGEHAGQPPPAAASSALAGALSGVTAAGPERALQHAARALRPDVAAGYAPRHPHLSSALSAAITGQADVPFPAESQQRRPPQGRGLEGQGSEATHRAPELRGARPQAPAGARSPHYLVRQPRGAEQGLSDPHPRRRFAPSGPAPAPVPAAAPAEEKGEEEACDDEQLCVVCLAVPKSHAFVPCGHRCVCLRCGEGMLQQPKASCPICRREATQLLQIFV